MPFMGLRPWTRMNCARMLAGLNERLQGNLELPPDMNAIRQALNVEFSDELSALEGKPYESIRLDSVYTRITGIAGQPLNDNNLGQTLINNYGRPYQEGFNNSTGFSARADDGRFSYYVSGEYQHSPSAPPIPCRRGWRLRPSTSSHCSRQRRLPKSTSSGCWIRTCPPSSWARTSRSENKAWTGAPARAAPC